MPKKKTTRANNGMGSIRQRSDGRWEARYTAPDGRQRSVYAKSEKEVTAKLRATLHELDSGSWREPSNMLLSEWFEIWLKDYHAQSTDSTGIRYRSIVKTHLTPKLGKIRVSKLLPIHVRQFISSMQSEGLAPSTIRHYIATLGVAMKCAIEAGLIKENPVDNIKAPRAVKPILCIIDREDIPSFIQAAHTTK